MCHQTQEGLSIKFHGSTTETPDKVTASDNPLNFKIPIFDPEVRIKPHWSLSGIGSLL